MIVYSALGIAGGARRVGQHRHIVGGQFGQFGGWLASFQFCPGHAAHTSGGRPVRLAADHEVKAEAGRGVAVDDLSKVHVSVGHRGDIGLGGTLVEDERHLLAPVDMGDRHQDVAAHGQPGKRHHRLPPIGELEGHHRAGSDALVAQQRHQPTGLGVDIGEGAVPVVSAGVDVDRGAGSGGQPFGHSSAECGVVPPPLVHISLLQVAGHPPQRPPRFAHTCTSELFPMSIS